MMRPAPPKEYEYLYRHFGLLFWQQCQCCGGQFKWEPGFRYLAGPFFNGAGRWKYLCCGCAPTRGVASAMIKMVESPPSRPPPPPNPPKRAMERTG